MTNLDHLRVSLTKHGSHKVADLIEKFPSSRVLENVWDKYKDIKIDYTQTARTLSADPHGVVPGIWDDVRKLGTRSIKSLVLVAIIFSHIDLIKAMTQASTREACGTVVRGKVIEGKAYTNLACILEELGFSTEHEVNSVSYDLSELFDIQEFPRLFRELINIKLKEVGWDEKNSLVDECIRLGLYKVFGISPDDFRDWLDEGVVEVGKSDEEVKDEDTKPGKFNFKSGHNPRLEGEVEVKAKKKNIKAKLLHNKIQNMLFIHLKGKFGPNSVGTEVPCSYQGASIDVVLEQDKRYIFYEIKTATSIRACIREAISQLLEYAYWPNQNNADQLIIVSQNSITPNAQRYIVNLRERFGIPVNYQQFDLENGELGGLY